MARQSHLTKGRMKRPALPKGFFSANGKKMRVKKEKAPSRFISNSEKTDDVFKVRPKGAARGYLEGDEVDDVETRRAALRQQQAEAAAAAAVHGNRKERRERAQQEAAAERKAEAMKGWEWYYRGLDAEARLPSEERQRLEDDRAERQGGFMKYNYLKTHGSWAATKAARRRERGVLAEYGIDLFKDAMTERRSNDGSEEEEEVEEFEEVEEAEEAEEDGGSGASAPVVYPCNLPVREQWIEITPYWEREWRTDAGSYAA